MQLAKFTDLPEARQLKLIRSLKKASAHKIKDYDYSLRMFRGRLLAYLYIVGNRCSSIFTQNVLSEIESIPFLFAFELIDWSNLAALNCLDYNSNSRQYFHNSINVAMPLEIKLLFNYGSRLAIERLYKDMDYYNEIVDLSSERKIYSRGTRAGENELLHLLFEREAELYRLLQEREP